MTLKHKNKTEPEYVRRGFDIDKKLYNKMRSAVALDDGETTKDFIATAIRRELKRRKNKGD